MHTKPKKIKYKMKKFIVKCRSCGRDFMFNITDEQYKQYVNGENLIQRIFPELSASQRELLISRTCEDCWDKLFYDDDLVVDLE